MPHPRPSSCQELLDLLNASTSLACLLGAMVTSAPNDHLQILNIHVESDDFQLDFRNEIMPIVIRHPILLCPWRTASRVVLIAALAACAAGVRTAMVVIAVDCQPWHVSEGGVYALPLVLKLVSL